MKEIVPEDYRKDETWKNRGAYWMAAVGSAVGLGNVWRFPWRVYMNGGGAFLIAYFIVLFLVGMPMLTQEMALGQKFQGGDVEAYGRINWRFRGIGLASVIGVFVIVTYYSVIIAYSLIYAVRSFESPQPWAYDGKWGNFTECVIALSCSGGVNATCPQNYAECENSAEAFFKDMTKEAPSIHEGENVMAYGLLGAVVVVWICIYFSVIKGVTSVSYVVYVTMPIPILFLLIMLIKALTLEGSEDGIKDYLSTDMSRLTDAQLWLDAITQCFFSLSVCMGVMTAYSSFTRSGSVALDEKVVAFADVSIAFFSGFCIYGVLGYLNQRSKDLGDDVNYSEMGGGALVFIAFPAALLTFEASGLFSFLFFFMLFLLGIDSAFSMIEACSTVVCDFDLAQKKGWTKMYVSLVLCIVGFLIAVPFCTDVGPYHMNVIDNYVNTKGMTFVGMMEAFALGWVYLVEEQYKLVGKVAVQVWNLGYWCTLIVATLLSFILAFPRYDDKKELVDFDGGVGNSAVWVGFGVCFLGWSLSLLIAVRKARAFQPKISIGVTLWGILGWLGAEDIREHVNSGGGIRDWKSTPDEELRLWTRCDFGKLSIVWGLLIKYFIPGFLFVLLSDQLRKEQYNPYLNLKVGSAEQLEGMLPFILMLLCVFGVMFHPECMEQEYDKKANTTEMTAMKEGIKATTEGENV